MNDRRKDPERASTTAAPVPADRSLGSSTRNEQPWRLQVVLAWFERARAAGLKTAEERRLARKRDE